MEFAVYNIQGKETGKKVSLDTEVFGIEPNNHTIYLDVKLFLANQRQGTAKAKARAEVAYSTKKIKRQKGTGGARAGSIKSPVFVGGGRVFGPEPRDYGFKLNKKVSRLARKSALSAKAKENNVKVIEDFNFEAPKTKNYAGIMSALQVADKKTLLVTADNQSNIAMSARNMTKAKVVSADSLNTYDIMNANVVLLCEGSLQKLNDILKK